MTKSQIEYILELGKLKNFGKAARACYISQSTLSAMVAKFEEQTGVKIFDRSTRPITITPQGEHVLKSLKSIYREFQLLDEKINEIKGLEFSELSIGCIPTVAPYLYPLILNKISDNFPKVNFTIHELTTENIKDEIIAGNIDVGIVALPLGNDELLEYPIYNEDFLIYDCEKKLSPKIFTVTDIDLDRLWLLEEGHCLRNQVKKICELRQQKKMKGNLVYSCGSIFTLIEMVKMNHGVTLLPRLALVNNHQIDLDCVHELFSPAPSRTIGLISHKNFVNRNILLHLVKIIEEVVKNYLPDNLSESDIIKPF